MAKGQLPERLARSAVLVVENKQPDKEDVGVHTKGFIKRVAALSPSTMAELTNTAAELGGMRAGPQTDRALSGIGRAFTGTIGIPGADELCAVLELENVREMLDKKHTSQHLKNAICFSALNSLTWAISQGGMDGDETAAGGTAERRRGIMNWRLLGGAAQSPGRLGRRPGWHEQRRGQAEAQGRR